MNKQELRDLKKLHKDIIDNFDKNIKSIKLIKLKSGRHYTRINNCDYNIISNYFSVGHTVILEETGCN